ncbi:DNA damage-inducible protein D [Candidatus Saccharibacteria bacterium]|nr:DNA damage-inducible protein D [Candidatus Saccharibacteria bacterium]NCU40670.1 DNA damage-inducible protein D [Candidatus Saccharibacteria bacterium]
MKKELIEQLFTSFENIKQEQSSLEYWSARELQTLLGYSKWENFEKVVLRAVESAKNSNHNIEDHFLKVRKMVELGSGSNREIVDYNLTRYACYLIAQNGDPSKSQIAFAQTYFAVQTRKQEIIEQRLLDIERVEAREKLSQTEKKLSGVLYERGVDNQGFGIIRAQGDQALFGGKGTADMKRRLGVPDSRPLADFLPTLTIKAKDFAAELTRHNVVDKDLRGQQKISGEHVANNSAVRRILGERGVKPELLPADTDVKKVQRKIVSEDKKALKVEKKKRQ